MSPDFEDYRSQFPVIKKYVYLNHAAISAPSLRAAEAFSNISNQFSYYGIKGYDGWMKRVEEVRGLFAGLINAHPAEIAFVGNTSEGLGYVAEGIRWMEGDEVLIPVPEFPSNVYPWLNLERKGVKTTFIRRCNGRFRVNDIEKAISPKVRLISVSYVDFMFGFRCDLEAIGDLCRRKGILLCVDAIQGLGIIPLDVKKCGIHFLATGGYKWLMSAMGIGGLYISSEAKEIIHPVFVGWKSMLKDEDFFGIEFDVKPNALGFEPGNMNIAGICALGAAIELIDEVGINNIRERVFAINNLFLEGLQKRNFQIVTSMDRDDRSGILSFLPHSDPNPLYSYLTTKNILVALRNNIIRISPHFYNNERDIENFMNALDDYSG
ncbi:MAG: aminotransferase class V-fold PLP-dependent enzyme [Spirochaetota bacterium]|nr:aminotransferase class V-fold PLP-dependent enzyme [Spirochaetota bacterium]